MPENKLVLKGMAKLEMWCEYSRDQLFSLQYKRQAGKMGSPMIPKQEGLVFISLII